MSDRFAPMRAGIAANKHREAMGLALFTFTWLVAYANAKTGKLTITQRALAKETGLSRATINRDIQKLKTAGYIETQRNSKSIDIQVTNWQPVSERYSGMKKSLSDVTTDVTSDVTSVVPSDVTRPGMVPIRPQIYQIDKDIINNTASSFGNPQVNELIEHFKTTLELRVLDGSTQTNRRYAWLLLKKSKTLDFAKTLIDLAAKDDFYKHNITSLKDLYYNAVKIFNRQKGKALGKTGVSRVAVYPGGQNG